MNRVSNPFGLLIIKGNIIGLIKKRIKKPNPFTFKVVTL